jgi:hypothetical protein
MAEGWTGCKKKEIKEMLRRRQEYYSSPVASHTCTAGKAMEHGRWGIACMRAPSEAGLPGKFLLVGEPSGTEGLFTASVLKERSAAPYGNGLCGHKAGIKRTNDD